MEQLTHSQPKKIAILGLANAGKSSIIKTILYEFQAFANILPTTGVDRTNIDFFGRELVIWDFGGQDQYREIYLTRPAMYFQGIRYLYYVVDAQDPAQLETSIDYFKKIIDTAKNFSDDFNVFLFMHKVDPKYKGEIDFSTIENQFLEGVENTFLKFKINPNVFHTSIYDPMSVISGFATPLLGNKTIYETLCDVLDSFAWEKDLPFALLFVNNFEIGSYYSSKAVYDYIAGHIPKYLDWLEDIDEFDKFKLGDYEIITNNFRIEVGHEEFEFNFAVGIDELFEPDEVDDLFTNMEEFTIDLKKILKNSEIIRTGELRTEEIYNDEILEERELLAAKLQQLEGLDEEDQARELQRMRELESLDDQYAHMKMDEDEELEEDK